MNNAVQLHNRVPNFFLNKINKSTVLSYHGRCTVCFTEDIFFISIPLSSKCLLKKSSISFPVVVSYIGFKQHSSSSTSPSQRYLAKTAKRGLSFTSMLSSRATLKTFAVFDAIACCLFTSLAMSVMRLFIVRAETGISWILKIMVLLLGKSSNKTSAQLRNASFKNTPSVNGFPWWAMHSAAL